MPVQLELVSEDYDNASNSWTYTAIYRNRDAVIRVQVRRGFYERQSYAKLETWSQATGWLFFTGLPTDAWYEDAPSSARSLTGEDVVFFRSLAHELLERLAHGLWGRRDGVSIDKED